MKLFQKKITWFSIVFSIWILLQVFWSNLILNLIPAWFSCFQKLGGILESLCASIVASYIFYFFVVYLKDEQDKETVSPYISNKITLIVSVCENQLLCFENSPTIIDSDKRKLKLETLEKCDIEEVFREKNPNDENRFSVSGVEGNKIQRVKWSDDIASSNQKVQIYIENLLKKITFLDSELVDLLTSLEDSIELSVLNHIDSSAPDLTDCSQAFFDYCMLVKKLKEYEKSKLAKYSEAK